MNTRKLLSAAEFKDLKDTLTKNNITPMVTVTDTQASLTARGQLGISHESVQSWSSFLQNHNWTFFVTFTTRYESSQTALRRSVTTFFEDLNSKSSSKNVTFFWVLEKHKHRGYHVHGLLNMSGITSSSDVALINEAWKQVIQSWNYSAGKVRSEKAMDGFHRNSISIFNNDTGALDYCLKYMGKDCADYDYFINLGT